MADAEDKGVVEHKVRALRLCDVEIMALSVWRWVKRQEGVWRVAASVRDWETNG